MKRYLLTLLFIPLAFISFAQTKGIQYQAIIQDPSPYQIPGTFIQGQALQNKPVTIRFTLKTNNSIDFEELHTTQTDEFGLINLTIGKGIKSSGSNFDQLVWSGQNKVLVVAVKIEGQSNFLEVSNQTLLYSPYALYADAVEYKNVNNAPKAVSHFTNDAGYLIANDLKPLEKRIADNQTENLNTFTLIKNQQIALETKVDEQGKRLNETILMTQNLSARIDQQNNQINQNQTTLVNQINNLSGSFESLGNKSAATDLGNTNPSNQLYPSQRAVKTYVDQVISTVTVSGTPDATTLAAGKIQLAGDLAGTASNPTVPGLALKENTSNKTLSISTDGTSDIKFPSARAVKTYVDQATQGIALSADLNAKADKISPIFSGTPSLPTGTTGVRQGVGTNTDQLATTSFVQQELNAVNSSKENVANKSTSTSLGTSDTMYPTQNAVKSYVDARFGAVVIPDASLTDKGIVRLGGDLAAGTSTAENPIIRDNAINTSKVADAAITDIKIAGISGNKVNGNIAGEASNVSGTVLPTHGGTGVAGTLTGYVKGFGTAAMQAVSTIPVADVNGAEAIANKSSDIAADAPSSTKYPSVSAVKNYVDNQIAQGTIPDATASIYGKIKLGGDLAGTGSSAGTPIITDYSISSNKIADLAVTNAKIVGIDGSKVSGNIPGNAVNVTGTITSTHGGTGVSGTLIGYIKGNGSAAMSSNPRIPVSEVDGAELSSNKSTAIDLGNTSPSDTFYPSQKAVKSYVDASAAGNVGTATQSALNLKENTANKSDGSIDANSSIEFPTQHAVKIYVENKLANQTISLANFQTINPNKLIGNFGVSAATPSEISTSGTGNVVRTTGATMSNVILNGTIGGNAILATSNGGLGTASLTTGYVKAGNPFSTVSSIPVSDITGAVQKVNGYLPDANGNIALRFGTTYTGIYNGGNFSPVVSSPINSDVYIVSADPTATNNGRAFIYDGSIWNEITTSQAALDARYVKLTGSTMGGNLVFPSGTKIQQADAPTASSDVANKAYVDLQVGNATPEATNLVLGKIQLGGDLAGPSSSASNPIFSNAAINNAKLASGAVTDDKITGTISGAKGGTGVNNTGKTITLGGNLTTSGANALTMNTIAPTNINLPSTGTLATLNGGEALTNKSINGLQLTSSLTGFTIAGGTTSKTLTVAADANVTGTNTGDQTITLTGDVSGSGTGAISTTLANTTVTAGVYGSNALIPQITVDAKGRISNVSEIPLSNTTLAGTILNDGKVLIGNASNAAVERNLSGDITMNNTGVTTIGTSKVTNAMLAGSIDLSTKVTNSLPIANGGTGVTSLTSNALLVGGTTLGFINPGAAGYILSSNGSTWSANAISSLGVATTVGSLNSSGTTNGMTLLGGELKLSPADASNPGVVTAGTQTIAGAKTFAQDLQINQLMIGHGGGGLQANTLVGKSAFTSNTTGSNNTAIGYQSLTANTSGTNNTGIGAGALSLNTSGIGNTAIGQGAGVGSANLSNTIAIGSGAIVNADNSIQLGNANITRVNTAGSIQAGSIQNTPIGSTTPSTGAFTGLKTTGTTISQVVLTDANNLLVSAASLPVNLGGTGVSTISSNGVMIGNGTGAINTIVPSASGQVLTWNGTAWTATIPTAVTVGSVGSSSANGLTITNSVLSLSPADATNPGIITTSSQTFAGAKTFASIASTGNMSVAGNLSNASLSASKVVFTDASKILSSTGTVGVDQGGTGASTFTSGGIIVGNGTSALSTINPGTNGQILVSRLGAWSVENASPTVTLGTVNASSTAKGLTITAGGEISLSPADATNPGIVTAAAQSFAGTKSFTSIISSGDGSIGGNLSVTGNLSNAALTASKVVFSDASKNLSSAGTVSVSQGGTGLATIPSNGVVIGNGTGNITTIVPNTNGQVLTYNGTAWVAAVPTAISAGSIGSSTANGLTVSNNVVSLSPADATNPGIVTTGAQTFAGAKTFASIASSGNLSVTGNLSNTSLTASKVVFSDASKILSSTGTVGVDQGGTGLASIPANGVVIGNGTSSISTIVPNTSGQVLTWNGTAWTATVPSAISVGTVGTSTSNGMTISNNVLSLSPADATNPGIVTSGAQTFAGAKTFASVTSTGNSSVGGTLTVTGNLTNATLSASKVVFSDASKMLSSTGTVGVDQGGTGQTTLTSGALIIGNGTGGVTTLSPSTAGYVLKVVGSTWTVSAPDTDESDQFFATLGQTSFTLTQTPVSNSKVQMFINGVRIDKTAYTISTRTITYNPTNNSGFTLIAGDRIQFDYEY
jgi:hypothetical protein